ncbi:MAG: GntR family transcriptional regulator [Rhizobiales bacterium]|nr:GntR family transcriptional regulator [Hyphomicrobiales bacterium]
MNREDQGLPDFVAAEPAPSLAVRAYERLRRAIETGQLPPRTRLREEALAEWLAMSRTPIREAVRRLEAEGFFSRDSRALVVSSLDQQGVAELYAMREVLEGTAAAFAARQASDVEIATLRELCEIELGLFDRPEDLIRHNERFHSALYGAAHNRYLLKTLGALRDARALLGASTLTNADRAITAHTEHEAIVSAIEAREPARADEAARAHIRAAQRERLRRLDDR